jgi:O-antigen ligase
VSYDSAPRSGVVDRLVDATLSETRPRLWSEAFTLIRQSPVYGVGPHRFAETSPTALREPIDTRWAHHELLQFGAETGVVGLLLGLTMLLWCFAVFWWAERDRGAAIAVLALAAVSIHSMVDYVFHFPAIGLVAAALVGSGSAAPAARRKTTGAGISGSGSKASEHWKNRV